MFESSAWLLPPRSTVEIRSYNAPTPLVRVHLRKV